MTFKIGFTAEHKQGDDLSRFEYRDAEEHISPVKSVVRVHFDERGFACSYYNDRFDLQVGDIVYVEGKMEKYRGRVIEVSHSFKIKLSDYKRVIAKADTRVSGELLLAGSHIVSADRDAIPFEKVARWVSPPDREDEQYADGFGGDSFPLSDLSLMKVKSEIAERGAEYYRDNKVLYIELCYGHGRAIVESGESYTVEFDLREGIISNLSCRCFTAGYCKHEFATLLQLGETLEIVRESYPELDENGYLAIISRGLLFGTAIGNRKTGRFVLK